jgi:hypothetical protein
VNENCPVFHFCFVQQQYNHRCKRRKIKHFENEKMREREREREREKKENEKNWRMKKKA